MIDPQLLAALHARVDAAKAAADRGDLEALHGAEDALLVDALRAIAEGAADPVEIARLALQTQELFGGERWYA